MAVYNILPVVLVSGSGSLDELGGGRAQPFFRLFQVLFNLLYLPVEGGHFRFGGSEWLFPLFQVFVGLFQVVLVGDQVLFDLGELLLEITYLFVDLKRISDPINTDSQIWFFWILRYYLVGSEVSILSLCLAGVSFVHGIVFFKLHRLHFLLDRVHGGCFFSFTGSREKNNAENNKNKPINI